VLLGVAFGGVGVGGVGRQVAGAAPHDTPGRKITRLRAKAARVQAAIDRMNARVESLVEDYNQVREAEAPYSGASVRIASIGRGDYIGAVRPTG
jgi:outer membrane murein-binding lipoprotein Lpp